MSRRGRRCGIPGEGLQSLTEALATMTAATSDTARLDPVLASILGRKIEAIAREMAVVLERTARSPLFQVRDFCTVVLDADGRILSQEEGLPQMAYAVSHSLRHVLELFGDDVAAGDMFIHNDPYYGGNQAQDTAILRPVFCDGVLRFWAAAKGHLADLGGPVLGGYNPEATDIWQENLRLPPLRVARADRVLPDVWGFLMANTRLPHHVGGDLEAQIGACRVAEQRLAALWQRHGGESLLRHLDLLLDATERRMRAELEAVPEGTYHGEATYDHEDPHGTARYTARLAVTIADGRATLDFAGTDPQSPRYINGAYGTTFSAAVAVFLMLVDPDLPHNDGVLRCLDVRVPEGTFLNATCPAPCVQGNFTCQDVAAEAIFRALSGPLPDRVTAGWNRGESHNIRGLDPRNGHTFFEPPLIANKGGGGATDGFDGWDDVGVIACGGGYAAGDYEIFEAHNPVRVIDHAYRTDSGGAGRFRGGLGIRFHYRLEAEATTVCVYGERRDEPFGLFGGQAGARNAYRVRETPEAAWRELLPNATYTFAKGAEIEALNAGGGGFGAPADRDSERLAADVRDGFISTRSARDDYGAMLAEAAS
jgi:N-methylhydantoinase B